MWIKGKLMVYGQLGKFFVYSAKTGMERMHRRLNVVKYLGWTEDILLKKKKV